MYNLLNKSGDKMNEKKYYLGVDGGGSKTTAAVFDGEGRFIAEAVGESINYYSVGRETARENLKAVISRLGVDEFECAVIGMSALNERADEKTTREFCGDIVRCNKIIMDSDLYIALEALNAPGECGTVISGTGSMAVIRNADGSVSHAGGWGYILGDEGSGYSIALSGIRAAIRAAEGSGVRTALLPACLDYFGINDIYELIELYYDKTVSRKVTAAFAEKVIGEAEEGDTAALDILKREAAELAATAKSLFDRIKSGSPIGLWGGIFQNSELYREIFTQKLGEDYKDRVKLLDFTPEIGAVIAALRENSVYINEIMLSNIKNTYRKATL